jgi:hypothetical protein
MNLHISTSTTAARSTRPPRLNLLCWNADECTRTRLAAASVEAFNFLESARHWDFVYVIKASEVKR